MSDVLANPTTLDLKRIDDREEAYSRLSGPDFERWEKLQELEAAAEENRREMQADAEVATDALVRNKIPDGLAVDVNVFGNEVRAYYDPESKQVREAAKQAGEIFDMDADAPDDLEGASVDELDDADIPEIKDALTDLITAAIVEWNGQRWDNMDADTREAIATTIQQPTDSGGWGVAGLMDAFVEIYVAVNDNRSERLERIQKFRNEERRGDR